MKLPAVFHCHNTVMLGILCDNGTVTGALVCPPCFVQIQSMEKQPAPQMYGYDLGHYIPWKIRYASTIELFTDAFWTAHRIQSAMKWILRFGRQSVCQIEAVGLLNRVAIGYRSTPFDRPMYAGSRWNTIP